MIKHCIVEVMAAEGMQIETDELLVTTGGQQVIDLVCKTLIDPGDVIIAEAPTYPGAIPTFCAYEADVVQIAMDATGCASTSSRRRSTRSSARAGARSSSTRCPTSTTPPA